MSKRRNIKYQFLHCINTNFREGMDKHSLKSQGKDNSRIFSFSDRKNLLDLSSSFSNWLKINYQEIKQLYEIDSSHIQEFLSSKTSNCSQKTLEQYQSRFRKLEVLANSTYHINVNYHNVVIPLSSRNGGGGKIRNAMLSTDNYNKLLKSTNATFRKALTLSLAWPYQPKKKTNLSVYGGGDTNDIYRNIRGRFTPRYSQVASWMLILRMSINRRKNALKGL